MESFNHEEYTMRISKRSCPSLSQKPHRLFFKGPEALLPNLALASKAKLNEVPTLDQAIHLLVVSKIRFFLKKIVRFTERIALLVQSFVPWPMDSSLYKELGLNYFGYPLPMKSNCLKNFKQSRALIKIKAEMSEPPPNFHLNSWNQNVYVR